MRIPKSVFWAIIGSMSLLFGMMLIVGAFNGKNDVMETAGGGSALLLIGAFACWKSYKSEWDRLQGIGCVVAVIFTIVLLIYGLITK
jgi:hypothetical protein